jgi:hypothetical protein
MQPKRRFGGHPLALRIDFTANFPFRVPVDPDPSTAVCGGGAACPGDHLQDQLIPR